MKDYTCFACQHSHPAVFCRGQARTVGHRCAKTGERVYPDRRAIICDMFEAPAPEHGYQPEMPAELL